MERKNENGFKESALGFPSSGLAAETSLHPAWRAFIRFCTDVKHGEIEILKIQDGLPILAEVTKKKVRFGS